MDSSILVDQSRQLIKDHKQAIKDHKQASRKQPNQQYNQDITKNQKRRSFTRFEDKKEGKWIVAHMDISNMDMNMQ